MQYFVEGKRQISMRHNSFGTQRIDRAALLNIIENAIDYTVDFDLLVPPPYDAVKVVTVDQAQHQDRELENADRQTTRI